MMTDDDERWCDEWNHEKFVNQWWKYDENQKQIQKQNHG